MKITSIGVISNDWHVPFQDKTALELFFGFCKREKPDWIDLAGDICDFYQVSRFDKNPLRKSTLQDDIDETRDLLNRLRKDNPKANIYYHIGNHEDRLRKFLWSDKGKNLCGLTCLSLQNILGLKDYDIKLVPDMRKQGDLYITHGTELSQHSGMSAKKHFEKYGVTLIHGHSHRDGKFTRRTKDGHKACWENYCLCQIDNVEYCHYPNWVQGFSKVTMAGNRPYVEQIPIINGTHLYNGRIYK